jgi:Sel1 repeat-containing protein
MDADVSAGHQPFTLDHSSFEKLLAAAWTLQCLQDQLHGPQFDRGQMIAAPVTAPKKLEVTDHGLQARMSTFLPLSPRVVEAASRHDAPEVSPAANKTLAQLIEIPPSFETGTLNFDVAAKIEAGTVEPKSLHAEGMATAPPVKTAMRVLASLPNRDRKVWARPPAVSSLRTALNRMQKVFDLRLPNLRINLSLRAVRAVAIATPVWVLSLVAALLFLEVWRHASVHSAQAISKPITPAAAEMVVPSYSRSLPVTTELVPEEVKRTDSDSRRSTTVPPLEVSHKRITDPGTSSAVEQLSRYEIKGLRRQAKYGDASAAFTLGMAYEVGRTVPQNCLEAARWVATAAEAGDAAAQYNLGLRYRDGDGVLANRAESEKWLRKAAARRNRQARRALKMLASR